LWSNPNLRPGQVANDYKFLSTQMVLLEENGSVLWENSLSLDNQSRTNPGKFGELAFDGQNLYFMYLDEKELKLIHFRDGVLLMEHENFEIHLIYEQDRIYEIQARILYLIS